MPRCVPACDPHTLQREFIRQEPQQSAERRSDAVICWHVLPGVPIARPKRRIEDRTAAGLICMASTDPRHFGLFGAAWTIGYAARITLGAPALYVSEAMLNWLFSYHTDLLIWSGNENLTLEEHESIVQSIERKDPDGAVDAMRMHLDRSRDLYKHRS
jgi:hypothetical protein